MLTTPRTSWQVNFQTAIRTTHPPLAIHLPTPASMSKIHVVFCGNNCRLRQIAISHEHLQALSPLALAGRRLLNGRSPEARAERRRMRAPPEALSLRLQTPA